MTSAVEAAHAALVSALRRVPGLRVTDVQGAVLQPPAAVVVPPTLTWEGYGVEPRTATWLVPVVVAVGERALSALLDLLPRVVAVISEVQDLTVSRATAGTFPAGAVELPAYIIEIEGAL